jgi:hypothetical protein
MKFLAIIAIGLGGYISLMNWVILYQSWRTKKFVSAVPIFGALFLGLGLAYFEKTRYYAFLSVIADYGTLIFIISIPSLIKMFWDVSRFNLIRTFAGNTKYTKYELKLYKKGIFVIRAEVEPPQIAEEHGAKIGEFGLQGKWEEKDNVIQLTEYYKDRSLTLIKTDNKYITKEINYPQDNMYKYDMLDGIEFILSN